MLTFGKGLFIENGSGGFLSDLYFVGGKFGYVALPSTASRKSLSGP
jgi:hypothetical protein